MNTRLHTCLDHTASIAQEVLTSSYTLHYWNKVSHTNTPKKDSLMYHALNDFCIFCREVVMRAEPPPPPPPAQPPGMPAVVEAVQPHPEAASDESKAHAEGARS